MERKNDSAEPNIDSLLFDLCEDRLNPELHDQLCSLLASDDEAFRRYVEVMHLSTEIVHWAMQDENARVLEQLLQNLSEQPDAKEKLADDSTNYIDVDRRSFSNRNSQWSGWLRAMRWTGAIAACLLVIGIIPFLVFWGSDKLAEVAKSESSAAQADSAGTGSEDKTEQSFVAQVIEATRDVTWAEDSTPLDLMLRVKLGKQIAIESGVLRLRYLSGAEVILHGPAVFVPTGAASGHLVAGRMTGKVTDSEEKTFRLSTPGAEVIDLGTVFGVAVSDLESTDVCVFDGEVEVNSLENGIPSQQPIRLQEGMSVRLSKNGHADLAAQIDRDQFLSKLPQQSNSHLDANEVSLIDAFIDGPGLSHRLIATLDPITGKPDEDPLRTQKRDTDGAGYRRAVYSEFVDGVIIPPRNGKDTLIDSYGHTIKLPKNTGRTYGTVWARRPIPGLSFQSSSLSDDANEVWAFGATQESFARLEQCRLGMIGLYTNVGITFDLRAIQSVEGQAVGRFHCTLTSLGAPSYPWTSPKISEDSNKADVRIYVDGVERFSSFGLSRVDGELFADVQVDAFSTTLSIFVTVSDGSDQYHQILLIDPTLEMAY